MVIQKRGLDFNLKHSMQREQRQNKTVLWTHQIKYILHLPSKVQNTYGLVRILDSSISYFNLTMVIIRFLLIYINILIILRGVLGT